jgi:hypothetical protein
LYWLLKRMWKDERDCFMGQSIGFGDIVVYDKRLGVLVV